MTKTTYELDGMKSELDRLAEMNASMSVVMDGGVSTFSFVNPDEPYTLSPPIVNGAYQSAASGTVLLVLGIDKNNDGYTDEYGRATGFMVSPKVMVTAGHCVYGDPLSTDKIVEVRVYPFYHGSPRPDKLSGEYFIYPASWIGSTKYAPGNGHDWSIVTLQQAIPNAYNFPCSYTRVVKDSPIYVTGYPQLNGNEDDCYQRCSAGVIIADASMDGYGRELGHTCNTDVGSSGSPIWNWDVAFPCICVGIHVSDFLPNIANLGVGIDENLYNYICDRINKS